MDLELLEGLLHNRIAELIQQKKMDDVVQLVLMDRADLELAMLGAAVEMKPRVERNIERLRKAVIEEEKKLEMLAAPELSGKD